MSWRTRFRLRRFVRGSIWLVPVIGGLAGSLCGIAASETGRDLTLPEAWTYSAGTAQAVLASVVGASVGLTGFVVTVAVLIVQMATGTFSARYMRIFYRDKMLKAVLAVLVGTLTFSYSLLRRVEEGSVPSLGVTLAGFLLASGVLLFLVFLNRSIHRLRPVAVAALVAQAGRRSFEETLEEARGPEAPLYLPDPYVGETAPVLVVPSLRAGAVQAVDFRGLARFARESKLPCRRATGGRRLRAGGGRAVRGLRRRTARRRGRRESPVDDGARDRTDDRAGPCVRDPGDGRHRDQGSVTGGQRPDHRRAGPRPPRGHAAAPRSGVAAPSRPGHRRAVSGRRDPCPALGRRRRARVHRDPPVRRLVRPGRAPVGRDARGSAGAGAARAPPGGRGGARPARRDDRQSAGATPSTSTSPASPTDRASAARARPEPQPRKRDDSTRARAHVAAGFVRVAFSRSAKNSSAFRVFVSCSPSRSTPCSNRNARVSAATWNASDGADLVESSRIRELSG